MIPSDQVHGFGNSMDFYDKMIAELPLNARVLEMGVFYGRGLVHLAQRKDLEISGVDQFIRAQMPNHLPGVDTNDQFFEACRKNVEKYENVALFWLSSADAAWAFDDENFDCVFLDGAHDYESVSEDIRLWLPKVKPGGYLAGDDYIAPWGGVIKAVDEAFPERELMGQTWYVRL